MTLSITMLSTISKCDTQHEDIQQRLDTFGVTIKYIMPNVYAEYYIECHYAECRSARNSARLSIKV